NAMLFLTATWNTTPYFLGSDIVFAFAWLPFVLVGATQQPALDGLLARATAPRRAPHPGRRMQVHTAGPHMDRRQLLRRGLAAAGTGTLAIAGMAILTRGSLRRGATALAAGARPGTVHHSGHHHRAATPGGTARTASARVPPGAVALEASTSLAPGQAITYSDPADGSPDIVVRHTDGSLSALSALCTHAGCQVGFQSGVLYCPCHGSRFDASTGAVLQGPAVAPLPRRRVIERGGKIYAVS
ncbi:MAG: QcrA and Rieske domain-containing protein, partial [Gaiellales bacterium]